MNPILLDFPHQFTTDRLLIRMPLPGDGKVVFESIQASINELKDWLPFARYEQNEQKVEENIRESHIQFLKREDLRLLIFNKETNEFVGSSGLHRINWAIPKFEIGYWIDSRVSGKGLMTEGVQGITDFAFRELNARRIEIRCDSLNYRSKAIPERLGYRLEGILKNNSLSTDESSLRDTTIFAKTR
ncbi:GNAT family N-acetyltransferase [Paenibacillus sp. sptzw28]|uniref:GNAT family N-acetyltransferase n=1 Tax=Paenibacillus sp. sptzw28 TaxID=715179 RepID=UPI001C6EDA97|nr:GNAT family N-acetyltransferase [Paenibacillus sp. sptzw28]QYR19647.1 GNAT family N-acetyltransferase [Paenibacillus sp. sptzw28]